MASPPRAERGETEREVESCTGRAMIRLYSWSTPNGNKLHIMLEECGLEYEIVPVNLGKKEQYSTQFLSVNPNAKIPAMTDSDGPGGRPITLFESGAMLLYLAEKTGRFLPGDPAGRYRAIQWVMFQMANIGPMFGQLHHFRSGAPEKIEYAIRRYLDESRRLLGVLEGRLGGARHLAGDEYSIADICTWPWCRSWIHTFGDTLDDFPAVGRWFTEVGAREGVRRGMQVYERLRAGAHAK